MIRGGVHSKSRRCYISQVLAEFPRQEYNSTKHVQSGRRCVAMRNVVAMALTDSHQLDEGDAQVLLQEGVVLSEEAGQSEAQQHAHGGQREAEVQLHRSAQLRPGLDLGTKREPGTKTRMIIIIIIN